MMFSNMLMRPLVFSKVSDLFSGWGRGVEAPPVTKNIEVSKLGDGPSSSKVGGGGGHLDQKFIDSKIESVDGSGQVTGKAQAGEANASEPAGMAEYKKAQQKKWQAQKDADARYKLFGQPTPGRVGGEEVEPFSSKRLASESESLTASAKAKAEKAAPARTSTLVRTAAIAAPFSLLALTAAGAANAFVNKALNADNFTKTDYRDAQIVEQSQKDVVTAANAWSDLKGHAHVAPELSWAMKDSNERMDVLEDLVGILEQRLAIDAKEQGIQVSFATTGAPQDDVKSRAKAINSRLAMITALFRSLSSKLKSDAT